MTKHKKKSEDENREQEVSIETQKEEVRQRRINTLKKTENENIEREQESKNGKEEWDFTNGLTHEVEEEVESDEEEYGKEENEEKKKNTIAATRKEQLLMIAKNMKIVKAKEWPKDSQPVVAKNKQETKNLIEPRKLKGAVWNTCRGWLRSAQERLEVLKRIEPQVDFIFLIDTQIQDTTINPNTPTKETKRKLSIPGWSFKIKKMDKNVHALLTKNSSKIESRITGLGIEWWLGTHKFIGSYLPKPSEEKCKIRLEDLLEEVKRDDEKIYAVADWNMKSFGLSKQKVEEQSGVRCFLDSKEQQGIITKVDADITMVESYEKNKQGKQISDHPLIIMTFPSIIMTKQQLVISIKKKPRTELSEQIALRFLDDGNLIDFSNVAPQFNIRRTGFREYKSTIQQTIIKTCGSARQDLIAYKLFNKLFGKEQDVIPGELPTGVATKYGQLINPQNIELNREKWKTTVRSLRDIDMERLIEENAEGRENKMSHSTALDAFGLCFEVMRQNFQLGKKAQLAGVNLAREMVNWFDYNVIDTFALKKKPDSTKFEDLRILSIVPTPWRLFEDAIIDQITRKVDATLSHHTIYQFGFLKGKSIVEAVARSEEQWNKEGKVAILIDVRKAYDTVNTQALLNLNLDSPASNMLWNCIRTVYQDLLLVRIAGKLLVKGTGLPQGSSLSPVLFIYLLHMALTVNETEMEILSKITAFADDIVIIDDKDKIVETFELVKERLASIDLQINYSKSEIVATRNGQKIEIEGIQNRTTFKYLGVHFKVTEEGITQQDEDKWVIAQIGSLNITIRHKLTYVKTYAVGGKLYDILHRSGKGKMDVELFKLRRTIGGIFKINTWSYLDLSAVGLDPFILCLKMTITNVTQRKKLGEPIRNELMILIRQLLMKWKQRTKRLTFLLEGFEFDFTEVGGNEVVTHDNYKDEKDHWKTAFLVPLSKQYRNHLAGHSRDEKQSKLEWVEEAKIRSLVQMAFWTRKMKDVYEEAGNLAQRVTAKKKVTMIKQLAFKTGSLLSELDRQKDIGRTNKFPWLEILKKPEKEPPEEEHERFAKAMSWEWQQKKHKHAFVWKRLFACVDLWIGRDGWYIPSRLADLELILEEADSEMDN